MINYFYIIMLPILLAKQIEDTDPTRTKKEHRLNWCFFCSFPIVLAVLVEHFMKHTKY